MIRMPRRSGTARKGVNPMSADNTGWDEELQLFRRYLQAEWYSSGRVWSDYVPAFCYGHAQALRHGAGRFEEVENALQSGWMQARRGSRLSWAEARGPVREAWQDVMPLPEGKPMRGPAGVSGTRNRRV